MNNIISQRLKKARSNKGLTQIQVMKKTNINHKTLSGYENGVSEPDLATLTVLAELYETTTDYLLGRPNKTAQPSTLTTKEERDLAIDLEKIMSDLESEQTIAFHGELLNEEDKELLRISLENSIRIAKQITKNKSVSKKFK